MRRLFASPVWLALLALGCNEGGNGKAGRRASAPPSSATASATATTPSVGQVGNSVSTWSATSTAVDATTSPSTTSDVVTLTTPFPGSMLLAPPGAGPFPAILLLHGSEGGAQQVLMPDAKALVARGYVTMLFCYFGCTGRPSIIKDIPLDETVRALDWLRSSERVQGSPVGIYGTSRGAEQAVLIASLLKDRSRLAAVAASAPFDYVVGAYDPTTGMELPGAAWTWQGQPLNSSLPEDDTSVSNTSPATMPTGSTSSFDPPFCLAAGEVAYWNTLVAGRDLEAVDLYGPVGRIRVEDYTGAMLLIHGMRDALWPYQATQRLGKARQRTTAFTKVTVFPDMCHYATTPTIIAQHDAALADFFTTQLRR